MKKRKQVIIIGANFAGLNAAKQLGRGYQVTLIDPQPYFEFFPNIHELLSRVKKPKDLRLDRKRLIEEMGHAWKPDRVTELIPAENKVVTADGTVLVYDACIVALGGVNETHGVPGVEDHAHAFKSVADCQAIGKAYKALRKSKQPFSVVIAGGGSEGMEGLGELLRSSHKMGKGKIHLVEAQKRLMPGQNSKIHKEVLRLTKKLPVSYHFGQRISAVNAQSVELANGTTLPSDLTIWTGGVKPHPLLAQSGLSPDDASWAPVKKSLQSVGHNNLFITGDAADLPKLDSKQAYFALETGEIAGKNVDRLLRNKQLRPYVPMDRPALYSFGSLTCFLSTEDWVVSGKSVAPLKEAVYQKSMADMQGFGSCKSTRDFYDRLFKGIIDGPTSFVSSFFDVFSDPFGFFTPTFKIL